VPSLWPQFLPHPEAHVLIVWVPFQADQEVQLECQGHQEEDHWNRPMSSPEEGLEEVPQRLQVIWLLASRQEGTRRRRWSQGSFQVDNNPKIHPL